MNTPATEFAFENPAWLAVVVLLPLLWTISRRSLARRTRGRRLASLAVRGLLLLLLAAGLAGPRLRTPTHDLFVVVVHDVRRSIVGESADASRRFREEVQRSAGRTTVREFAFPTEPGREDANLAETLAAARVITPADAVPRIVLLTNGNAAGDDARAAVAAAGCEIDVVPLEPPKHEVYVAAVESPGAIRRGETFFADVVVESLHDDAGRVILQMDDAEPLVRDATLTAGTNRFRFRNLTPPTGPASSLRLSARIEGCRDTLAENNRAAAIVCVQPPPRVLLVDSQPRLAEPLHEALEADGDWQVTRGPPELLPEGLARLLDYDLVIVSNVPAAELPEDRLAALHSYVHDEGGGFIVIGGTRAFTAGDYGGTAIEAMLPVEDFDKPDKPRPTLAMLLVLDRSGSMQGAPIELARQAARQAVSKLGPADQVGIIAFEDRVHWIAPLQPLADADSVSSRIDAIAAGGGTNIAPALDQAHLALRHATADRKHIILLSDGISHPADFDALATRIAADGISISTVGVGDEASEQFLRSIADLAGGHAYFCVDPSDMPSVFEADVLAAGRHGITEEPFQPVQASPARMLAGFDAAAAPPLLGYVDTRVKPGCPLVLSTPAGDPLLAWRRYGRGVAMAFTSDVHSRWAVAWQRWEGFGPFWRSAARQAMRGNPLDRFHAVVVQQDGRVAATLDAVTGEGRWLNSARVLVSGRAPGGHPMEPVECEFVAPGRYTAQVPADAVGDYHMAFTIHPIDGPAVTIERGFTIDYPSELRILPANVALLREIAEQSGGRFAPSAADVLRPADAAAPRTVVWWPWLLLAATGLFVLDVGLKR